MKRTEYIVPIDDESRNIGYIFIGEIRKNSELIRCKDCKYYSYGMVEGKHMCMSVKYRFTPTAEYEWCSRAERKEEE